MEATTILTRGGIVVGNLRFDHKKSRRPADHLTWDNARPPLTRQTVRTPDRAGRWSGWLHEARAIRGRMPGGATLATSRDYRAARRAELAAARIAAVAYSCTVRR